MTDWGYSDWYQRGGGGSLGAFEELPKRCLDQAGVAGDPSGVAPNSPEETAFAECMNGADWCTQAFHCDKPGA